MTQGMRYFAYFRPLQAMTNMIITKQVFGVILSFVFFASCDGEEKVGNVNTSKNHDLNKSTLCQKLNLLSGKKLSRGDLQKEFMTDSLFTKLPSETNNIISYCSMMQGYSVVKITSKGEDIGVILLTVLNEKEHITDTLFITKYNLSIKNKTTQKVRAVEFKNKNSEEQSISVLEMTHNKTGKPIFKTDNTIKQDYMISSKGTFIKTPKD